MAELFKNFEINRRDPRFAQRLLRTAAGSVVLHAVFVALVVFVPTVRSMFHIATMFSDADYVEEDYTLAEIRERAVMVKLGPTEKLYYPPGYFSANPAAPAGAQALEAQVVEEVRARPAPPPRRVRPTPQPTPDAEEVAAVTPTPSPEATPGADAGVESASATPSTEPKTDAEVDKLAAETGVKRFPKINSKPFKDLLTKGKEMMDKGAIDLQGTLSISIEADRNEDGTLANVEVTKVSSTNEELKNLALDFVRALSASRALVALEGTKHLRMQVESNPEGVSAVVTTEMESEQAAKDKALGFNGLLFFGSLQKKGRDEEEIFKSTKVSASGKDVVLNFTMSRESASKILAKQVVTAPGG